VPVGIDELVVGRALFESFHQSGNPPLRVGVEHENGGRLDGGQPGVPVTSVRQRVSNSPYRVGAAASEGPPRGPPGRAASVAVVLLISNGVIVVQFVVAALSIAPQRLRSMPLHAAPRDIDVIAHFSSLPILDLTLSALFPHCAEGLYADSAAR